MKIGKGRLFFHFNPKLCFKKIQEFATATNKSDFTEFEVAANGDKIACTFLLSQSIKQCKEHNYAGQIPEYYSFIVHFL